MVAYLPGPTALLEYPESYIMQTSQNLKDLLGIKYQLIQAPMAGVDTPEMAIAVSQAGGLGSLACATLSPDQIFEAWRSIRQITEAPINLNFFCHEKKELIPLQQEKWLQKLRPYYQEFDLDPDNIPVTATRAPFDENFCSVIEDIKPPVVSFHFGLPETNLLNRVKETGAVVLASATTAEEAIWLQEHGCDVVIAQGLEAGGHRGLFLTNDIDTQIETKTLVSQIIKAVSIPVVAAGGIADVEGIQQVLSLGASAVQLGTAFMFCHEANISPLYRKELEGDEDTVLTNIFSGRPARGILNRFIKEAGPMSDIAPDFPYAALLTNPLRKASEGAGNPDFMQMWSGTVRRPHKLGAGDLVQMFCKDF